MGTYDNYSTDISEAIKINASLHEEEQDVEMIEDHMTHRNQQDGRAKHINHYKIERERTLDLCELFR